MGMFDFVWVNCPICGEELEFQSKSGPCELKNYQLHNAPLGVQSSLIDDGVFCSNCQKMIVIKPAPIVQAVVETDKKVDFEDDDY